MTKTSPTPATQPATKDSPLSLASAVNALTRKHEYPLRILTRSGIKTILPGLENMVKDPDPYISQIAQRIIDKRNATVSQGASYSVFAEIRLTPPVVAYLKPYLDKLDRMHQTLTTVPDASPPDQPAPRHTRPVGRPAGSQAHKAVNG